MRDEVAVAVERFGPDHWSTFMFAETVWVDRHGSPDIRRMRCDRSRHPQFAHMPRSLDDGTKYPTRLAGDVALPDHDDWDCIDDCAAAGLLTIEGTGMHPIWKLTDEGQRVASALRAHRANGGTYATFALRA